MESSKQTGFEIDSGMFPVPRATAANPHTNVQGHLFTKKEYSWYKVRRDYRFGVGGGTAETNAGLIIHGAVVESGQGEGKRNRRDRRTGCPESDGRPGCQYGIGYDTLTGRRMR